MTAIEALNELIADLRQCEKSLDELRIEHLRSADEPKSERSEALARENADRLSHKLSGLRLAIGLTEIRRNDAIRDETEAASSQAVRP